MKHYLKTEKGYKSSNFCHFCFNQNCSWLLFSQPIHQCSKVIISNYLYFVQPAPETPKYHISNDLRQGKEYNHCIWKAKTKKVWHFCFINYTLLLIKDQVFTFEKLKSEIFLAFLLYKWLKIIQNCCWLLFCQWKNCGIKGDVYIWLILSRRRRETHQILIWEAEIRERLTFRFMWDD